MATAGIGTMATGLGATATAGIAATATAVTATVGIGPAMESSAVKCAGAQCGVQVTFAVGGYIETPNAISRCPRAQAVNRALKSDLNSRTFNRS